jgi:glycosyltransferase involved in cell wall biosynthesis
MQLDPRHLLHVFPSFAVGGAQMRFVTLANALGDRYRHTVLALDGDYACAQRVAADVCVRYETISAPKQATLGNVRRFRRRLRDLAPDVLITHNWGAIEWAVANIPPLARHIHIEDGFGPEERSAQIRRRVLTRRWVLSRSTVVLPSRNLWRIATEIWRLDPGRVRYVPNGIDIDWFTRVEHMARDVVVVGTVAGLRAEKNIARLLHAFRLVCASVPTRLHIVGDGPERRALQELAQRLGLEAHVEFMGQVNDPVTAYRSFDIFALSSDTEQMPLSVLEAMASGLPIAATDVGDVPAMVADENRAFVTPLAPALLAGAITTLARDPALRARLGTANRAKARADFGLGAMIATYAALFDSAALVRP